MIYIAGVYESCFTLKCLSLISSPKINFKKNIFLNILTRCQYYNVLHQNSDGYGIIKGGDVFEQ